MGINVLTEQYEQRVLKTVGKKYPGLKWCELGNQRRAGGLVAKDRYQSLGVKHISIDLNSEDGSLPIDLDYPVPFIFISQFDVVTNYGTSEHVNNQYQVFKNIHDMCQLQGVMLHAIPLENNWPGHCRYYYSIDFLKQLAGRCGYRLVKLVIFTKGRYQYPYNLIFTALVKTKIKFISLREFNTLPGIVDSGDLTYTGKSSKKVRVKSNKFLNKFQHIIRRLMAV